MELLNKETYIDKSYAGLTGMICGVIYGSTVESGVYDVEKIKRYFNLTENKVFKYKKYAADDDINGPIIFSKAYFNTTNDVPSIDEFANVWMDNIRYEKGMFWWGPSTERKAYENLLSGIPPNQSGSVNINGRELCNQIGGQIFIDTFGIIYGGYPSYAVKAASNSATISHDENGLEGAKFISACISNAYLYKNIEDVINSSLEYLDDMLEYKKTLLIFINAFKEGESLDYAVGLVSKLGYDSRNGYFGHIIPNAAVIITSLLWGNGDFEKTLNICIQMAWDTDCNASNVGTILGVMNGTKAIRNNHFRIFNDEVILSSAFGSENIVSISSWLKKVYEKRYNETINELFYHNNATYGISLSNESKSQICIDNNKMFILISGLNSNQEIDIYKKYFYTREELQDTRYQPVFSSNISSGNIIKIKYTYNSWQGDVSSFPYYRLLNDSRKNYISDFKLEENLLTFEVPDTYGSIVREVGVEIKNTDLLSTQVWGEYIIEDISITYDTCHSINMNKMIQDLDTVTPYSIASGGLYLTDKFYEHDMNCKVMRYYSTSKLHVVTGVLKKYNYKCINYLIEVISGYVGIIFDGFGLNNSSRIQFYREYFKIISSINGSEHEIAKFEYTTAKDDIYDVKITYRENKLFIKINNEYFEDIYFETSGSIHGLYNEDTCEGEVKMINIDLKDSYE